MNNISQEKIERKTLKYFNDDYQEFYLLNSWSIIIEIKINYINLYKILKHIILVVSSLKRRINEWKKNNKRKLYLY